MFGRHKWLFLLILAGIQVCQANGFSEADYHFLIGYDAFLKKNYANCASHLLETSSLSEQRFARAQLFLAACQVALGYKNYAAMKIDQLSEDQLPKDETSLFRSLKRKLSKEIAQLNQIYVSLSPYYGQLQYNSGNIKTGGTLYGAGASLSYQGFSANISGEQLSLSLAYNLPTYTQTQGHADVSYWLQTGWMLRGGFTYISASTSALSGIQVYELGTGTAPWTNGLLTLDLNYSTYPNSTLTSLRTYESTLALRQLLLGWSSGGIYTRIASQTILPQADVNSDKTTGFSLRSMYERGSLDLSIQIGILELGGSGWIGNEAFGVRNEGAVVYNALEEHQSGWGGFLGIQISSLMVRGSLNRENYQVGTTQASATTYMGSAAIHF